MTLTDLASEIERLDAEATPGPWTSEPVNQSSNPEHEGRNLYGPEGELLAAVDGWSDYRTDHANGAILVTLRNNAAHLAQALRLLERAHNLAGDHISEPCVQWFADYAALCAGIEGD